MSHASELAALRRPRVLVRAARLAALDYRRGRDLAVALGAQPGAGCGIAELLALEGEQEDARRRADATYSVARHVALLAALIAESRAGAGAVRQAA